MSRFPEAEGISPAANEQKARLPQIRRGQEERDRVLHERIARVMRLQGRREVTGQTIEHPGVVRVRLGLENPFDPHTSSPEITYVGVFPFQGLSRIQPDTVHVVEASFVNHGGMISLETIRDRTQIVLTNVKPDEARRLRHLDFSMVGTAIWVHGKSEQGVYTASIGDVLFQRTIAAQAPRSHR